MEKILNAYRDEGRLSSAVYRRAVKREWVHTKRKEGKDGL